MAFKIDYLKPHILDEESFLEGKLLYDNDKVTSISVNTFWKTEPSISGIIEDDKIIHGRLSLSGDRVTGYGCSCDEFKNKKGPCRHIVALALKYQEYDNITETGPVYTSTPVRRMVNSYLEKIGVVLNDISEYTVKSLKPDIEVGISFQKEADGYSVIKALFYIKCSGRRYLIKNLYEFTQRINKAEYFEYGKHLGFIHTIDSFNEKSREMVLFLCVYTEQAKMNTIISDNNCFIINNRELVLYGNSIDEIIDLSYKNNIPVFVNDRHIKISDERPAITVNVKECGNQGYSVTMEGTERIIKGIKNLYVLSNNMLYICNEQFAEDMGDFLVGFCENKDSDTLNINKKDMSSFYNAVIQTVEKYAVVNFHNIDTDEFRPWNLFITFNIDINEKNEVTVTTDCYYDDVPFDIITGRTATGLVNRDYFTEYKIRSILNRYFGNVTETGYRTSDYEKIFKLLSEGIDELGTYGKINISKRLSAYRIIQSVPITASVRSEQGLFNMNVDIGDYTEEELSQVLNAYKQKNNYVILNNKGLIRIEDSQLDIVANIMETMEYTAKDIIEGTVYIPRYRSLYIDRRFKSNANIKYNRDEAFKSLVKAIKHAGEKEYPIPDEFENVLRGYQETGYYWLRTLDECGFGGILADDMGLGKTIQILSLIDGIKEETGDIKTTLIVTPSSLIYNWENEIKKFAPKLRYISIVGSKSERKEIIDRIKRGELQYDVLITSYELLKRDTKEYEDMVFRLHIIDEAQYIKNYTTENSRAVKKIKSLSRFALTGTPIENRLSELWSIFDFIMPGSLYSYKKFKEIFETPIINGNISASDNLKEIAGPFILRRMKNDVLKELPDKLEYEVYAKLEGEQQKLYLANALKLKNEIMAFNESEINSNKIRIFAELTRLRQICCDPSLCYEDYDDESAKLSTCMELIKTGIEGGHKILLFSQFTTMLDIIKSRLEQENISYYILTGKTKKENRMNMVENFSIDDTKIFLISLKAGGTGLNLTAADMVIHYDPWWNKAAEIQAADRTHRIGQKNTVSVFRIIAKDTIEEYIIDMQNKKMKLADDILRVENEGLSSLTKDDLLRLLE